LKRSPTPSARVDAWLNRGMLVAFALISLVGMPAQDIIMGLTFWTMAFWYVARVGPPAANSGISRRGWVAIAIVVLVFAGGTSRVATGALRVPVRAQRVGWPYTYGFFDPEADETGATFRWTGRRAVAVVEATGEWMDLTISANHRDIETRPVGVKVWRDGELLVDSQVQSLDPVTRRVRLPPDERRVIVEVHTSRVVRPSDFGMPDDRELGVMVRWAFTSAP
jgi:hypothetical protein